VRTCVQAQIGAQYSLWDCRKNRNGKLPFRPSSPCSSTSENEPVLEPWYQNFRPFGAIGFPLQREHNPLMALPGNTGSSQKRAVWKLFLPGVALLASSLSLFADTPARLHAAPSPGCYCRCAPARRLGTCVKMCEMPKYASRWWAVSCAKPHGRAAGDNRGAGPRLHHRDRAEHAQL
jgi:hypothetical protein